MELTKASKQWSTRPADQRFLTLADLHSACTRSREASRTKDVASRDLRAIVSGDDVQLIGSAGNTAALTHWSFGQLAARANAPAGYLRSLPAQLATDCINHGLENRTSTDTDDKLSLLFHVNGSLTARAITTDSYTRIWDSDITARLIQLAERGPWQPAPAAMDGSRGLYASDHDMFAFLVDNDRRVFEKAPGGGLSRGFFVWNSEVGSASFGVMTFLYNYVCANHIVWGASNVKELRLRHVGAADQRAMYKLAATLREYADHSASEDEAIITRAMSMELGTDKDQVLDRIFGLRVPELSRSRISEAYQLAESHTDWYGSPRSIWGMTNGLTELARDIPHADDRVRLDRAAAKVMELAF